ncbi:hypothetical protein KBI23_27880 [bacterium]|nr:hypothetical protein [bacterium]MBP9811326.1 hypothetical protein [bacterium]
MPISQEVIVEADQSADKPHLNMNGTDNNSALASGIWKDLQNEQTDKSTSTAAKSSTESDAIEMNGTFGKAERIAIVAGKGLLETPQGMVDIVEEQGVIGLCTTAVESTAVGYGLQTMLTKAAPVAKIATLTLGASFLAKTIPEFHSAFDQGLKAKNWNELDKASATFGEATGSLAVDTIIGFAGYKAGAGYANHRQLKHEAASLNEASAKATEATETAATIEPLKPIAEVSNAAEATEVTQATEVAKVTDAEAIVKKVVSPEDTISMRELAERNDPKFEQILNEYYPKLEKAFPDASEIESAQTYRDYLHDPDFAWDMNVLRDKSGNVLGGIQSQVVEVGGSVINKAVWAEHIWLDPEARTFSNFQTLLKIGEERASKTGSDIVFMEFNDRAKMTWQQQLDDAEAGLSPEARERIWGRVGLYVLGDKSNHLAPYSQPAMGDGAPVNYLSIGVAPLKSKTLDGQTMPTEDYLKLIQAAHATIPDVNLATDPTVVNYTGALNQLIANGETTLAYARLKDTHVARLIQERFIGGISQPKASEATQ